MVSLAVAPGNETRAADITGLILAGGQGRRLGGLDKGLVEVAGRRLVEWTIARFAPQVSRLLISANRHTVDYGRLGYPVIGDREADYAGPLAGMAAGLAHCSSPFLAVVPCDSPFLPHDLVQRLGATLTASHELAVVSAGGRLQPVFALLRRELGASLDTYLASGERKIDRWYARHAMVAVTFDDLAAFDNINDPESLATAAIRLHTV